MIVDLLPGAAAQATADMRLDQARRLQDSTGSSCKIVLGLIVYVAVLMVTSDRPILAGIWLVTTAVMVGATYIYSYHSRWKQIDESNYQSYLTGHIVVSCITGFLWSGFAIYQLDRQSDLTMVIACSISLITLGGLFPSSAYRATFIGLLTCLLGPQLIAWLIIYEPPQSYSAIGLVVYYVFGLVSSAKTEINMRDLALSRQAQEANEKLSEQNHLVENANEEKTRFMVATVHDFSQPLHAQGYFIHALRNTLTEPRQLELLDRIEASWQSQGELVQAIADITRLDGGQITPRLMAVDVPSVLENTASEFRADAEQNGIELVLDVGNPTYVKTDPTLYARIIRNLVSNSIKFTPSGGKITVAVNRVDDNAVVTVTDTGVGIPDKDRQRIFEEYVQLNNETHDRRKGLGVGLSIVKRLVSLLGIELKLRSKDGQGTVFELVMPAIEQPELVAAPTEAAAPFTDAPLILVVDDEADVLDGMTALLESLGCEVMVASSAAQALKVLTESPITPDLFIFDKRLGSDDGLVLIDQLRDEINEDVPAILMTGDVTGLTEVDERDDVVLMTKPANPDDLHTRIEQLHRAKRNERQAASL